MTQLQSIDARTGQPRGEAWAESTAAHIDAAADRAAAVAGDFAATSAATRAALLRALGAALEAERDTLAPLADSETALGLPRLNGEIDRTVFQLRGFADVLDHGDIAKSVRFGASMVMIGSLFAGHEESPGKTVEVDGQLFKEYYGSASDFNKGEYKHVEGKRNLEPVKGKLADTLVEMEQDVQSSISYSGGKKLMDIRKVNYVTLGGDNAGEHLLM